MLESGRLMRRAAGGTGAGREWNRTERRRTVSTSDGSSWHAQIEVREKSTSPPASNRMAVSSSSARSTSVLAHVELYTAYVRNCA